MKKIIIGIHGLKNKAPEELLKNWWIKAIRDGLEYYHDFHSEFEFDLVYWADLEYEKPLDATITEENDPLYLKRPYVPFQPLATNAKDKSKKQKLLDLLESGMDKLFLREKGFGGLDAIADITIRTLFSDLDIYYNGNCKFWSKLLARDAFHAKLENVLQKYPKHQIMLIGHSMGTIISYDTLTEKKTDQQIDTFVTLGSPLGLPVIIKKILREQKREIKSDSKPKTPEKINRKWLNFTDLNDKIALNYNLSDDYSANSKNIKPVDFIVDNQYEYNGQGNPHNVYGYLRTPQVAQEIQTFLGRKESIFQIILRKLGVR